MGRCSRHHRLCLQQQARAITLPGLVWGDVVACERSERVGDGGAAARAGSGIVPQAGPQSVPSSRPLAIPSEQLHGGEDGSGQPLRRRHIHQGWVRDRPHCGAQAGKAGKAGGRWGAPRAGDRAGTPAVDALLVAGAVAIAAARVDASAAGRVGDRPAHKVAEEDPQKLNT